MRGRRQVVWLCESLASFGEHFSTCEAVLFRLAQVETERSIGNNSTAIWRTMFQPVLAFTQVPFPERADLLLRRLAIGNERTLGLILSAVIEALGTYGGRMAPPTIVGGRVVPEPWRPETHAELYRLQREFGRRALEAVGRLPMPVVTLGRQAVVANLSTFVRFGLISELRGLLDPGDGELRRAIRPQLRRIVEFRIRAQERRPSPQSDAVLQDLRRWEEDLQPTDLAGRLQELTSLDYWEVMRGVPALATAPRPSPYAQLAQAVLSEPDVLRRLGDWFASDKALSAFNFAVALGEADEQNAAAPTFASWLEAGRCRGAVAGYLRGVGTRQGSLPVEWSQRLERATEFHAEYAAIVTVDSDFSERGFQRVMRLVQTGTLPPSVLIAFNSPNWEPHVGLRERRQIIDLLLSMQQADRNQILGTALSLGTNWTNFGRDPPSPRVGGSGDSDPP